jgi:fucose permease
MKSISQIALENALMILVNAGIVCWLYSGGKSLFRWRLKNDATINQIDDAQYLSYLFCLIGSVLLCFILYLIQGSDRDAAIFCITSFIVLFCSMFLGIYTAAFKTKNQLKAKR